MTVSLKILVRASITRVSDLNQLLEKQRVSRICIAHEIFPLREGVTPGFALLLSSKGTHKSRLSDRNVGNLYASG
jgi:hypothetical protein